MGISSKYTIWYSLGTIRPFFEDRTPSHTHFTTLPPRFIAMLTYNNLALSITATLANYRLLWTHTQKMVLYSKWDIVLRHSTSSSLEKLRQAGFMHLRVNTLAYLGGSCCMGGKSWLVGGKSQVNKLEGKMGEFYYNQAIYSFSREEGVSWWEDEDMSMFPLQGPIQLIT